MRVIIDKEVAGYLQINLRRPKEYFDELQCADRT